MLNDATVDDATGVSLEVTDQLTHHRCQQKSMKIKGLWLTSRSSDYHMQSWRNSRPPSESDWVVATTRTPSLSVTICLTTTKSVYLPKRGGWKRKKITSGSDSDVEWSNRACKWTMGPPVQRLTRRLPREIRVLSLRPQPQAGRSGSVGKL